MPYFDLHSKNTVIGGTLFSTLPNIGSEHFITTFIMAVFGAIVSFMASLILKWVFKTLSKNNFKKRKE